MSGEREPRIRCRRAAALAVDAHLRWPGVLLRWSLRAAPREAWGLLVGTHSGEHTAVHAAALARYLAPAPAACALDPGDFVRVHDAAAARGLRVVGVWHSHVGGPPCLSQEDRATAWPGLVQVVVGPLHGTEVPVSGWLVEDGH